VITVSFCFCGMLSVIVCFKNHLSFACLLRYCIKEQHGEGVVNVKCGCVQFWATFVLCSGTVVFIYTITNGQKKLKVVWHHALKVHQIYFLFLILKLIIPCLDTRLWG